MSAQPPLISRGALTGRVYLVTRYKDFGDWIEAVTKVDITEQYEAQRLADSRARRPLVRPSDKGSSSVSAPASTLVSDGTA